MYKNTGMLAGVFQCTLALFLMVPSCFYLVFETLYSAVGGLAVTTGCLYAAGIWNLYSSKK